MVNAFTIHGKTVYHAWQTAEGRQALPRTSRAVASVHASRAMSLQTMTSRALRSREVALLRAVCAVVLMVVGLGTAWADDYSGQYYISGNNQGKDSYNIANRTTNYYLCPTVNWIYYDGDAASKFTATDNGQPFLTTYQYRNGINDASEALWRIRKHATQDYYYIIHEKTGKYLVSNPSMGSGNGNRLRVHLEDDIPADEDFALFTITHPSYYNISPKKFSGGYLNVTQGNQNSLQGTNAKTDGPTGYTNVGGTLGLWTNASDFTSKWYFEPVEVEEPTFTINAAGEITINHAEGTTVRYTTDGSTAPTASVGTLYDDAAITDISAVTAIKAVAIRTSDDLLSTVATLPMVTYNYRIINLSKTIATIYSVKQPVGQPLSGYTSIPAAIRSGYLSGETVTFYSFSGTYNVGDPVAQSTLDSNDPISATPAGNANIYVTYTQDGLSAKFLPLSNAKPVNIKNSSSQYIYDNSGTLTTDGSGDAYKTDRNYLWYITGSDPYAVQIQNAQTNNFLTYDDPTLGLGVAQTYLLKGTSSVDATHETFTLRNADGEEVTLTANSVVLPITFTLVDKKGYVIQSGIAYNDVFELPAAWQSPLVTTYKYYKEYPSMSEPYDFTEEYRITRADQRGESNVIYVTYDVGTDIDLDGRNLLGIADKVGKTYMLQFVNSANTSFYQENSDAVMGTKRKAVYPYSNGDGALYVYGEEKWQDNLSSGASTRTRWLWYIEPANSPANASQLDPYHVKISSYQTQTNYKDPETEEVITNFHSYLRTYQPDGHNAIVTGVTNDNPLTFGRAASSPADNSLATEYMILGTSLSNCHLTTVQAVGLDLNGDGDYTDEGEGNERRTIHSFEQYWKNNPTVQGKLTTKVETLGRNVALTSTQKSELAAVDAEIPWHVYEEWANAQPWVNNGDAEPGKAATTGKKFLKEEHAFQTIEMGNDLAFVETTLDPMLILLDQHGWEIARVKLPSGPTDPKRAERYAEIHKYSSPMVERYHFWKTGSKVPGYHKFTVSDYATVSASDLTEYTADELGRADLASSTPNLPNYESQALVAGKERDWYVTYDVKSDYTSTYAGAATKAATQSAAFLVKQGDSYAKISGTSLDVSAAPSSPETATADMQWYVRPNFDIDKEMGYLYFGESGAQDDAPSQEAAEAAYFAAGQNGFDPYNVQIQSVANTDRYFTTNTSASALVGGAWEGTTSTLSLQNLLTNRQRPTGYDQTTLNVTNATFMVVDDGSGNMVLMPRFDHTKMLNELDPAKTQVVAAGSATQHLELTLLPTVVEHSSDIKAMGGHYILSENFDVDETVGTASNPFRGTIDGGLRPFSASRPLLAYADSAVIKNLLIESASVSSGSADGNVGTICCEAMGDTRIYNCGINGGTVSGSNYVGGLVGLLDGAARVINCYSYADITGGAYVGGIVGYNNVATTANDLKTMVMNCMYYGDITGGTNKAPIYNGKIISNIDATGVGNYNYFSAAATYAQNRDIQTYNCALMAEERFLTRFEFYRHLLNGHRNLAAWWATDDYNNKDEMLKWVLEPSQAGTATPYPILKAVKDNEGNYIQYHSVVNIDAENATAQPERNKGGLLGSLNVSISMGSGGAVYSAPAGATITNGSLTLNITDKDPDRYNFNYRKVQLPYYNDVGSGNYTGNRVVTGWKITGITTDGSVASYNDFTTGDDAAANAEGEITAAPYNFADRRSIDKDKYDVSGRVFNQGAYWDVPEGVTGITIQPYWAKAAYLADGYADVVYNPAMSAAFNVPNVGGGEIYKNGSKYSIAGENQVVYTSVGNARNALDQNASQTVYDCAIVLVGNAHNIGVSSNDIKRLYTIMSADFDHDNEPDYSYILRFDGRNETHPVRLDFINIPGLGMAQKSTKSGNNNGTYNFGICQPIGWFESTNTSLFRVTQFEYDRSNRAAAPLILQGGVIEQWVSGQNNGVSNKTTYYHVGGNVWFKEFHRGTHQDKTLTSKHPPISVTGGDYDEFYLTGLYRGDVNNYNDNAECYINGGRFGILAGAGQEGIGNATTHANGNIVWQIQNADIDEFYGGGFNAAHPVEGNITTVITGGYIKQFCGGPKFGDMNDGKTVKTTASGCIFDNYYGAGYGGNSYSRRAPSNQNNKININWNSWVNGSDGYSQKYDANFGGVETQINYQFLPMSGNADNVCRLFVEYVSFSLATTHDVTSTLTGCTINNSFYGGGRLGKVDGPVTSTLTNCTVSGSAYGAGYSASLPTVEVMNTGGFQTEPVYNENLGIYLPAVFPETVTYTWEHAETVNSTSTAINTTDHKLYTTADLTTLGEVTGLATLNINGTTSIGGSVYGGGESSDATGDVTVNVNGGTMTDVYGGGYGQHTVVGGDITVNIGAKDGEGALSGSGAVSGNVYGGSALGAVNATSTKDGTGAVTAYAPSDGKTATVNIYGGAVNGSVFGGGLGQTAPSAIAAQSFGDAIVNVEGGTVTTAVYGGANVNGVLKQDATVTILGGTVSTAPGEGERTKDVIFGGGKGEPTLVEGTVTVNIGMKSDAEPPVYAGAATIHGSVYGGSALGNTNASKSGDDPMVFYTTGEDKKTTTVNLYGGRINGDAYGGGLGQKNGVNDAESDILSYVGGDVLVLLDGAQITGNVFGCNNLNGTPKGHVKVWVKRTNNLTSNEYKGNSATALADRTTYDVTAVYGGGNRADYIPTDALLETKEGEEGYDAGNLAKVKAAMSEVVIEGCAETSIQYVYGGGNAAAVPADSITILSCYIIDQVFGGGNGAGAGNPGADVGVIDKTAYAADNTTGIYGTGIAKTKLVGGQVHYVYGGSNTLGNVRGGTQLERKESNECELKIGEIYGAGQVAPMDGDVNIELDCMPEEFVEAVYGGAKNATINGNVSLTVRSGKFGRVFGGNDQGGSINGSITVNVYEGGCEPLIIGELYGGGYNAPYSIWGCNDDDEDGTWTPNTPDPEGTPYVAADADAIQVNVYSCTSIGKVFGGGFGATADVVGNTRVWINEQKGFVNDKEQDHIGKIAQVFGGGYAASLKGNVTVEIGTATSETLPLGVNIISGTEANKENGYLLPTENAFTTLEAGIYGGGMDADVDGSTTLVIGTVNQPLGVNIAGNIFGGGYGQSTTVTGDVTVNIGKEDAGTPVGYAAITGDVYGGSAKGKVNATKGADPAFSATADKATTVNFYGGTLTGNLYGGGLGDSDNSYAADVYGPVTVNVKGGSVTKVFGCNNVLGSPQSTAAVNLNGGTVEHTVYGGGNLAAYNGTGGVSVTMTGGTVTDDVFGGGLGTTAVVNGGTSVTLNGGTVERDVYGGGSEGNVTGAVTVALNGGSVGSDAYGGGALAQTNTAYASGSAPANTYITNVTLAGATVTRNVYGGGLGQLAAAAVLYTAEDDEVIAGTKNVGDVKTPAQAAVAANVGGPVAVTVTSGSAANVFGCNNVNGAPQSTVDVVLGTKTGEAPSFTYGGTATISGSVYGGGNLAAYTGSPAVKLYGGTVNTNVYGGGLGATAVVTGNTTVTMESGTVKNDVYGGGSQADVTGSVAVTIAGGTVTNDVYGGGALANTNTGNWAMGTSTIYVDLTSLVTVGTTTVTGLYTESGGVYTEVTTPDTKAATGVSYYEKRDLPGSWAAGKTSASNTTTVILTGGVIGNAYGGGLGDATTPVYVFGDVAVRVNKAEDRASVGGSGAAFTYKTATVDKNIIPLTGRVFGCNNIKGTPLGNVSVEVYATRQIDEGGNYVAGHSPNDVNKNYEIQAVYGGGNQADYLPAADKKTQVLIDGCQETSIARVYGGGNSASVPATDVTIDGSYDIGYAFGGGNGGQKVLKNGIWVDNDGASVTGLSKITCHGGKIGEIFGGSDAKGDCLSTSSTQAQSGGCPLRITKLYGAGKEANVDGNVNVVISACTEGNSEIEYVCGGSYKAHISGDVTLTITSGFFKNVYGGNDQRGGIGGNITVNIEETEGCEKPIIIQNLVGGGNEAPYPGTDKNEVEFTDDPENPRTITVNVKSATRIDNVFGGGFLAEARGNTVVNINMVRGNKAGNTQVPVPSYYGPSGANAPSNITNVKTEYVQVTGLKVNESNVTGYYIRSGESPSYTYTPATGLAATGVTYWEQGVIGDITASLGTIGNVYGGGNQGVVRGNTTVNIGTATKVPIMRRDGSGNIVATYDGSGKITSIEYDDHDVLGAHITGDVFGGGNLADVTGSTTVNLRTASYASPTNFEDVKIEHGSVYGGGNRADVLGNTNVTMSGGYVFNGIFGGGLAGSVGTFTRNYSLTTDTDFDHSTHTCLGKPTACADGTGKCTVVVDGGQIGPDVVATEGMKRAEASGGPVPQGWVWGGGCGVVEDPSVDHDTHFKAYVGSTDVTIGGTAFILESVIGGGEFGRVLGNTLVKIQDNCQIGVGAGSVDGSGKAKRYADEDFIDPTSTTITNENSLAACSHFDYESPYEPYDPYYSKYSSTHITPASTTHPTDGQTRIGSVWGGGSGYMPYEKADGTGYEWMRSAGMVEGSTKVLITGGHILTNVYGGNEYTDVTGDSCVVIMTGGTIGVPRTQALIQAHPLTGNIFGGGKGDQRSHFNSWTNVTNTRVYVGGTARIYGSVFGGGEDGHVTDNTKIQIYGGSIGSVGTSSFDGNVFGGGRGFSGTALTAGTIGGNADITIQNATVLGNVYGGGRMASVGVDFTGTQSATSGQFTEDGGNVTINISGTTTVIGNSSEDATVAAGGHTTGGNVYGGGMGRLTLLDGTPNPLWVKMAQAKSATINISGSATIKSNVYGGPELGTTRDNATINLSGSATVNGSVFGGGYGSEETRDDYVDTIDAVVDESTTYTYRFTPMMYAGCLGGNSAVTISGGTVGKSVYGGGELATVGVIDYLYADGDYVNIKKHTDTSKEFALSWPYDLPYLARTVGGILAGKTTVTVSNGRIGGNVYGGGKGKAMERYAEAFCANVRETQVNINYGSTAASTDAPANCIVGEVYGGAQDGHVMGNAAVSITGGLIGQSVYGGGRGEGTYRGKLRAQTPPYDWGAEQDLTSWTAGKVYGNTSVAMSGGKVLVHVYGGGNLASVGKGNYAGGADDYFPSGYGEALTGNLWDNVSDMSKAFVGSGKATVAITGGEVGSLNGTSGTVFGTSEVTPTGMVFGGSRGRAAEDVMLDPRHEYAPDFYLGYVNATEVTIGTRDGGAPRIYSQVFGGGRDGHVRGSAHVIINDGTIGQTYAETTGVGSSTADYQRYHRGNVYGSGSGLGVWTRDEQSGHGMSSGSVTRNTTVDIYGGTIYNNVYGGGALSSVGPPLIGTTEYAAKTWSLCQVNIHGGTIGDPTVYNTYDYGGCVYGASRGRDFGEGESVDNFATTLWNEVNVSGGTIAGSVYGGGQAGRVKKDNVINLTGGEIKHDVYGGGQGTTAIAANVGGNTTVELNEGVADDEKGCIVDKIFGCNDMNGTPKGHVLVHVYATQNSGTATISDKVDSPSVDYDVTAVYGGGDLAQYEPTGEEDYTEVIIEGCDYTSIQQVYGGGNAACVPATNVSVRECHIINELFGGGNGLDKYVKDGKWYENPGANVGYYPLEHHVTDGTQGTGADAAHAYKTFVNTSPDATTKEARQTPANGYIYGTGWATTTVTGGHINYVYGGSNEKGNIRSVALSQYQKSGTCPLATGTTYGGSKNAPIDAEIRVTMDCVTDGGTYFGGSANSDINNNVTIDITNGTYAKVFGGNDKAGTINGSITINIEERGCTPIIIGELYGGGFLAPYSVYGYKKDGSGNFVIERVETDERDAVADTLIWVNRRIPLKKGETGALATPYRDPQVNIISATHIGNIYGGGYKAKMIGNPSVNVNMTNGIINETYASDDQFSEGTHTDPVSGINYTVESRDRVSTLAIGTIGTIYGGGNQADVIGNTTVEIGTGQWRDQDGNIETKGTDGITYRYNTTSEKWEYLTEGHYVEIEGTPTPARKAATITGSVYGGGKMGHVGDFTLDGNGKPISCADGTGTSTVVISNGSIGPDDMTMFHLNENDKIKTGDHPDDAGHVFGGGQGTLDYYYDDTTGMTEDEKVTGMRSLTTEQMNGKVATLAFVDNAYVTVNGTAFVKGSVFGGAENGHVLHDTHVNIGGDCQIGNGHIFLTDGSGNITHNYGVNRPYTPSEWADGALNGDANWTATSLPECASWLYGKEIDETGSKGKVVTTNLHSPYDKFADADAYDEDGGVKVASSGRTFYGSVFAGGSGFYPYAPGKWLETAGEVEGDAYVNVTGGHILTSLYGGNEMSSVLGDTHVTMTGGTVGVPRTLAEITAHPVTCYVFGGGKGEARPMLNNDTDVRNTNVIISGGWVYGSVFGGAEDGHVEKDATVTIEEPTPFVGTPTYADFFAGRATRIGTWGTSYVDGNIFGGGRGFDGHNMFAGCIEGNVNMTISGGEMLGSIYGGGRLGSVGINSSGVEMADVAAVKYTSEEIAAAEEGDPAYGKTTDDIKTPASTHGHVTIDISGGTIGNDLEYKYYTFDVTTGATKWSSAIATAKADAIVDLEAQKVTDNIPQTEFQAIDSIQNGNTRTYIYRLVHTRGGNVYAGGMGRLYTLSGSPIPYWFNIGGVKDTKLTIRGADTKIKGNVYGGCELGQVAGTHKVVDAYHRVKGTDEKDEYAWPETLTDIRIQGGTIGSEIKDGEDNVKYTYGSVFGSGFGDATEKIDYTVSAVNYESNPKFSSGLVEGGTSVRMTGGTVLGSVYGGGQVGNTHGNSLVNISGGTIGKAGFGDLRSGNVFGGGFGNRTIVRCGQIYGNATVTISGTPTIYHHVYGGGGYGSVGQFKYDLRHDDVHGTTKVYGVLGLKSRADLSDSHAPSGTTPSEGDIIEPDATGSATVTITGGTIGSDGLGNGNVFGSSYGDVANPLQRDDFIGWVYDANVTIGAAAKGTGGGGDGTDYSTPLVRGNVYGSGDNGHTFRSATVAVHSGTIGVPDGDGYQNPSRGNVYGAGNGIETHNIGESDLYKAQAGIVYGNTTVNIDGGLIVHNVYGGGEMASVGHLSNDPQAKDVSGVLIDRSAYKHDDPDDGFALSWPYKYMYGYDSTDPETRQPVEYGGVNTIGGKATVNISGGHIGVEGSYGGDVFGGSQGLAGDRYAYDDMSNVRETEVNITYDTTADMADITTLATPGIAGSVHGGAENGHVVEDAHVTLSGGLVAHSLYGAGKGKGTYSVSLTKIGGGGSYDADIYSLTAGKVYGNTYVTMTGGHVARNVYGGGNMGSVGKGNYAGGADDYSETGYGETLTGNLWSKTEGFNPYATLNAGNAPTTMADYFLSSGQTYVSVTGGTVGYIDEADPEASFKDGLPYGNVFGGCRGESAPNVPDDVAPRYQYIPSFYSGYVNETDVKIGKALADFTGETAAADYAAYVATGAPKILGSVYGGGQDGHVRRWTHVTVNNGDIGLPYTDANRTLLKTNTRSRSAELDNPQWLYRGNVYGGGSGISEYEYDFNYNGQYKDNEGNVEVSTIDGVEYPEVGYSSSSGSVTLFTQVDINGGIIHRNVYGGGSLGSVGAPPMGQPYLPYKKGDMTEGHGIGKQSQCTVNIAGIIGTPDNYVSGFKYNNVYGGEVYGASRGDKTLDANQFGSVIWTVVNLLNGAHVQNNVFGGGDNGMVKRDAEVNVGVAAP